MRATSHRRRATLGAAKAHNTMSTAVRLFLEDTQIDATLETQTYRDWLITRFMATRKSTALQATTEKETKTEVFSELRV